MNLRAPNPRTTPSGNYGSEDGLMMGLVGIDVEHVKRDQRFVRRWCFPNVTVTQDPSYLLPHKGADTVHRDAGPNRKVAKNALHRRRGWNETSSLRVCVLRFTWSVQRLECPAIEPGPPPPSRPLPRADLLEGGEGHKWKSEAEAEAEWKAEISGMRKVQAQL